MKSHVRIAKQLVKVARMLVAFNRSQLEAELSRKRSDLKEDKLKEHLDCLEGMDAKEQKVALYWISKKRLILPEDLSKFQDAINLINKQHLDFQKFEGPMEVINRNDKSTLRIKSQDAYFNPASEKAFSNPYNAGDGVVIYEVEDSREGQQAVRRAIDANWGYDKNPWCLAARKNDFDQNEINTLSEEQEEELGFYSDDALAEAWDYWNNYDSYPKRIAFKNGKLLAFSAGDEEQHVQWWDKNDETHDTIPGSNAADDLEFLKRHGQRNLLDVKNASPEMFEELAEDEEWRVRSEVAKNPNTPVEVLRKLAEDENERVRREVAKNPNIPVEVLRKLAEDENETVTSNVAKNPKTPPEILRKLAEDEDWHVRYDVARNPNTPVEVLRKLAEDENGDVRWGVATNPSIPAEAFMKLAEDEDLYVRMKVAGNPKTPPEILMELAEDEDKRVREEVARNPSAPVEILRKLAEDEDKRVREAARLCLRFKQ